MAISEAQVDDEVAEKVADEVAAPDAVAEADETTHGSQTDEVASADEQGRAVLVVGMAVCLAVAVAGGMFFARVEVDRSLVVLALGAILGASLALLAITRFAAFLMVLIVMRASLDGLKLTGVGASAISEPGVIVGGVLLVACVLWLLAQRAAGTLVAPSRTARWVIALAVIAVVSSFGSADVAASGQAAIRVLAGALVFVVLEQLMARRPVLIRGFLLAAALSLVVPAVVALGQLSEPEDVEAFVNVGRIEGTFVHPNSFGAYLVVLAVVALALVWSTTGPVRTVAVVMAIAASTLLLFTYARGAWAALIVGAAYLLYRRRRAFVLVIVGLAVALVLFVPSIGSRLSDLDTSPSVELGDGNANSFQWRLEYWGEISTLWQENPVTGIGLDQVPTRTAAAAEPHSAFVQAFVELGLLGLTALVGLVVVLWLDLARARSVASTDVDRALVLGATAVAAGFLLQLFTENLLTQVAIHVYLWIPIAYATALTVRARDRSPAPAG